jgi:hypothetical protein
LNNDTVLRGIPDDAFPVENAESTKGFIQDAAVSMIIPKEIDKNYFHKELESKDTNCYQFGQVWLRKPRVDKTTKNVNHLVAFDWIEYWPDTNLGDASTLITWSDTYALYLCRAGSTYLRNRNSGCIITNKKGKLAPVKASMYDKLRSSHSKSVTIDFVKENTVLLDYLVD